MKSKEQLVEDIFKLAKEKVALPELLYFTLEKGDYLAKLYQADQDLVKISICFMDLKLQEAKKSGNIKEHVKMAADFAKKFLKDYDISKEYYDKIINGIECHHGKKSFTCIEAEICLNADCYLFIDPKGVFSYLGLLAKRNMNLQEQMEQLSFKLEEKYRLLTLDEAKKDLEESYQMFHTLFSKVLENKEEKNRI